ncbi:MAG: hypothetical protein DHS20C02_09240 [Micavibrio sp.]|nr:MAG: hypothetical protein DHS20C02_09240 [Micavibrio sp.]
MRSITGIAGHVFHEILQAATAITHLDEIGSLSEWRLHMELCGCSSQDLNGLADLAEKMEEFDLSVELRELEEQCGDEFAGPSSETARQAMDIVDQLFTALGLGPEEEPLVTHKEEPVSQL